MMRKIAFGLLWVGFMGYAVILAPPNAPDTLELIRHLFLGQWEGIDPLIIALFNLMGIWPLIYGCLLFADGREQKIPAWPFVVGSFAVGTFALLPYLALRESNPGFQGEKDWFLQVQDSRWFGLFITLAALALLSFGLFTGNWSEFISQWQTSRFINAMSLDFCLLSLLFPTLLRDDMTRRGINNPVVFWSVSLVPLLGPLIYLCWRPSL
ncbi:MAG: DUF2834 domain-containing protein [Prochloron sp. SP5CPC1]|nr:DUF2834 domain-containing protein [Candidatus Paraprochloron terpiosi SP5CPC1]